jgi:ATP-binding cassette subfamily B protein
MGEVLTAAGRLLAMSWRQSPAKTLVAAVLMVAGGVTMPLVGLALRGLFDAVFAGETGAAVTAAPAVAALLIGSLTFSHFAHIAYFELSELNLLRYDEELITLANGSPQPVAHEVAENADRLTMLDQEVQQTRAALQALLTAAGLGVGMLVTGVLLAQAHPLLLLLPLVAVPPLLAGRRAERVVDRARDATAERTRLALNLFRLATGAGPAKELRVFGLGDELRARHAALWQDATGTLWRARRRAAALHTLGQLVFAAGYVAAVLLIVREAIAGRGTVGDVVLVIVLAAQVNGQVAAAVGLLPDLQRLTGVERRLRELREAVAAPAGGPDGGSGGGSGGGTDAPPVLAPPERLTGGITLRDVWLTYPGTDAPVLREVNLHLPAGATVAVVGENGAGKSSLIKLLCGFYRPSRGSVLVDGLDLARIRPEQWWARLATGFQDFVRYEFTAGRTVGLGDPPRMESTAAIEAALDRAHAADVVERLPHGLATPLGKSYADGAELSGGQWQKLALGRAFMRERPLLLVLDEPTSALDAMAEHRLFERYAEQASRLAAENGAITVLVSHRFSTVRMADLIVVVARGRIAEAGDHESLIRAGGLYAELYGLQARAYR